MHIACSRYLNNYYIHLNFLNFKFLPNSWHALDIPSFHIVTQNSTIDFNVPHGIFNFVSKILLHFISPWPPHHRIVYFLKFLFNFVSVFFDIRNQSTFENTSTISEIMYIIKSSRFENYLVCTILWICDSKAS